MNITFLGATKTVTGSNFLLEVAGKRILIYCGLYQGKAAEERDQAQEQTQILKEKLRKVQENLKLYDVVFESMDSEEQWLIEEYYGKGKSIDTLLEMQREKGQFVSKSTMRRRKRRTGMERRRIVSKAAQKKKKM